MNIDDVDKKIIEEYLKDARLSYREVAKRIGVAVGTALSRTRKMEEAGIIKGYTAIIDHEKVGYQLTVVTEVVVSKGKLVEMENEIAKLESTCAVYDITGLTDAIIIAKFKGRGELSRFTKYLLSLPYVERTNTHIVLTTVKEDFRLQP